jgi:hypothetical protein
MHRVRVQIEQPSQANPGGAIVEASYSIDDDMLRVYDEDGRIMGSVQLKFGDNPVVAARRILREKRAPDFYRPIRYH